jgi:hypothetical protein
MFLLNRTWMTVTDPERNPFSHPHSILHYCVREEEIVSILLS